MPNELIPFTNDPDLLIYPIVDYEHGLPVVECQGNSANWHFNCPFCGKIHSHYIGDEDSGKVTQRTHQRIHPLNADCKAPSSPFNHKAYYIRQQGDELNGRWDKYLQLLDSKRGPRRTRKEQNPSILAFAQHCLLFDNPNASTSNLELQRAFQLFQEQHNIYPGTRVFDLWKCQEHGYDLPPLRLDFEPEESASVFSRRFHVTFPSLRRKRLRDGTIRQWAFVGVQVDWLKLGQI
jgi:hypothetical protein